MRNGFFIDDGVSCARRICADIDCVIGPNFIRRRMKAEHGLVNAALSIQESFAREIRAQRLPVG